MRRYYKKASDDSHTTCVMKFAKCCRRSHLTTQGDAGFQSHHISISMVRDNDYFIWVVEVGRRSHQFAPVVRERPKPRSGTGI
jgi:hypothetical protein